jgi:hypothetical protein
MQNEKGCCTRLLERLHIGVIYGSNGRVREAGSFLYCRHAATWVGLVRGQQIDPLQGSSIYGNHTVKRTHSCLLYTKVRYRTLLGQGPFLGFRFKDHD